MSRTGYCGRHCGKARSWLGAARGRQAEVKQLFTSTAENTLRGFTQVIALLRRSFVGAAAIAGCGCDVESLFQVRVMQMFMTGPIVTIRKPDGRRSDLAVRPGRCASICGATRLAIKALEREILQLFLTQLPELIAALRTAATERDWRMAAHSSRDRAALSGPGGSRASPKARKG